MRKNEKQSQNSENIFKIYPNRIFDKVLVYLYLWIN